MDTTYKSPAKISIAQQHLMLPLIYQVKNKLQIPDLEQHCFESCELKDSSFRRIMGALRGTTRQKRKQKIVACWILARASLSDEQRAVACASLGDLVTKGRVGRAGIAALFSSWELNLVNGAAWASILTATILCLLDTNLILVCTLGLVGAILSFPVSLILECKLRKSVFIPAIAAIGQMHIRESVDILAGLCVGRMASDHARESLDAALPILKCDDYGQMRPSTLPWLLRLFDWYTVPAIGGGPPGYIDWTVLRSTNLLNAIEKIGDKRAIPILDRFIKKEAKDSLKGKHAISVLDALKERQRQEDARTVLLRGSSASVNGETLLCAASGAAENEAPAVLLRAADGTIEE